MLYCATCRSYHYADASVTASEPPYSAVHVIATGEHLHPITREILEP